MPVTWQPSDTPTGPIFLVYSAPHVILAHRADAGVDGFDAFGTRFVLTEEAFRAALVATIELPAAQS